jgi:hypothetical protein
MNIKNRDTAMKRKTKEKTEVLMPRWLQGVITAALFSIISLLVCIQINTNQISDMQKTLARIEERTKDIEDMKSGVDKLLGKSGMTQITPTTGGTLSANNVQIEIPPNSVTESTWFSIEKIPFSSLPAVLQAGYQYSDGFDWSTEGVRLGSNANVKWGLTSGTDCEKTTVLHWNTSNDVWQEVPTEYCSASSTLLGFYVQSGGYYVLARKVK